MKLRLKPLALMLGAMGCSSLVFADPQADMTAQLQAVNKQMQLLQAQIKSLQGQVGSLKTKLHQNQSVHASSTKTAARTTTVSNKTTTAASQNPTVTTQTQSGTTSTTTRPPTVVQTAYIQSLKRTFSQSVTMAPYTGVPTYFDGHELIVNDPSINEDVKLLNRRDQEMTYYKQIGDEDVINQTRLVLSGALEGITLWSSGNPYTGGSTSDIDLATAKLDTFLEATPWVSGLMTFAYDNTPSDVSANRVDNSRIFLDKGFITIGDMMKSPFYGSIGQFYVPFGRYSSSMISSPLTAFIGKTKERAIVVGYHPGPNRPYAAAYVFHATAGNPHGRIDNYGLDLGYDMTFSKVNGSIGVSYITSISDALGLQDNGLNPNTYFGGFAHASPDNNDQTGVDLQHNVGGVDAHLVVGWNSLALVSEYVTATRNYAYQDLSFDSHGAEPSAMNNEITYSFNLWTKPSSFSLDYGFTRQALALNIPRTRYGASFEMALMRHTLLTFEYRHDINYGRKAVATGLGSTAYESDQLGHASNTVTAQLGVYF